MIPLIPYQHWTIQTTLSKEEAVKRLSSRVWKRRLFTWFPINSGGFEGAVSDKGFCINRIIKYRNSFLPVIWGKFLTEQTNLTIELTATIHPIPAFMLVIFASVLMVSSIGTNGINSASLRGFITIAFIVYIVIMIGFVYELPKARRFLDDIFSSNQ